MTGAVHDIAEGGADGRLIALVVLDGEDVPREVAFWPELRAQWGADKLRRFLITEAARARDRELADAAQAGAELELHRDTLGDGTAIAGEFEPVPEPADHG